MRAGHTVVKLQGPDDPMIDLRVNDAIVGDEVLASTATLTARVTNGSGATLVVLRDGAEFKTYEVAGGTFTEKLTEGGRFRAEVRISGEPRTVTSNLWVSIVEKPAQSCNVAPESALVLALFLMRARRRKD